VILIWLKIGLFPHLGRFFAPLPSCDGAHGSSFSHSFACFATIPY